MLRKISLQLVWPIAGFVAGLVGYHLVFSEGVNGDVLGRSERHISLNSTSLTNPLLECDLGPTYLSQNTTQPFKARIEQEIEKLTASKDIATIAYYFRDLNNGAWFGFNQEEQFVPASLTKVPLMISVLAQAEEDPNFLRSSIQYDGGGTSNTQYVPPKNPIQVGQVYTVEELLKRTIIESDNNAALLLATRIGNDRIFKTLTDLGALQPNQQTSEETISVKSYASFFRILFNSSYLSRAYSESALQLLTQTDFNDGLRASVPNTVTVAHKFGEREWQGQTQFHDCGIVYVPKKPYLLCIMTRGSGYTPLVSAIQSLSKITYDEVVR